MCQSKIQIFNLNSLSPEEPFGGVGKALEVFGVDADESEGNFRLQMIELPPNKSFEPHVHVAVHIIIVIEGSGSLTIWESKKKDRTVEIIIDSKHVYTVSKGDMFFIPKGMAHAMASSQTESLKEIIINIPGIPLKSHDRIVWI